MNVRNVGLLLLILPFLLFSYRPAQSGADALGLEDTAAISTTIPIQGSLRNSQGPVNGSCDLRFALYNASQGGERVGPLLTQTLTVTDGLFSTDADFGDVWDGNPRWLQIEVRCPAETGDFVLLAPRQAIQATPYALRAKVAESALAAPGDFTATGGLRSARPGDSINAGYLELENTTSGDKWQIPIRPETGDSLAFLYLDAATQQWRWVGNLDREGQLTIRRSSEADGTLLGLDHPKVHWRFVVDPNGHPEMGVYDVANAVTHWNVLDIDPNTGNMAIGGDKPENHPSRLMVFGTTTISTSYPLNTTLLELTHPKTQVFFHVDADGHPEIGLYEVASQTTRWNVLDFDPTNGHVGVNANASPSEQLKVEGNFTATGTKAATVDLGEYGQRKFYAVEAADVRFSDEGLATLHAGEARVTLDPVFAAAIEQPYIIHLTPYADASLYVAEIQPDSFVVRAREGDANATFAWRLSAPRRGYAHVRLEEVGTREENP